MPRGGVLAVDMKVDIDNCATKYPSIVLRASPRQMTMSLDIG